MRELVEVAFGHAGLDWRKYVRLWTPSRAATAAKMRKLNLPKTIHDQLGLRPGDYLQVEVAEGRVVFTPKTLVDKRIDRRIAESAEDFAAGRSDGPFESAEAMVTSRRDGRSGGDQRPRRSWQENSARSWSPVRG